MSPLPKRLQPTRSHLALYTSVASSSREHRRFVWTGRRWVSQLNFDPLDGSPLPEVCDARGTRNLRILGVRVAIL